MTLRSLAGVGHRGEGKVNLRGKGKKCGRGGRKIPRQIWVFM